MYQSFNPIPGIPNLLNRQPMSREQELLAQHMVPMCVFRNGICPEAKPCNFTQSEAGGVCLREYQRLMKYNQ